MKTLTALGIGIGVMFSVTSCGEIGYTADPIETYGACSQSFLDDYNNVRLTEQGGNNAASCQIFFANHNGETCAASSYGVDTVLSSNDLWNECYG